MIFNRTNIESTKASIFLCPCIAKKGKLLASTTLPVGQIPNPMWQQCAQYSLFHPFPNWERKQRPIKNNCFAAGTTISPVNKIHWLPALWLSLHKNSLLPKPGGDRSILERTSAYEYLISVDRCWLSSAKHHDHLIQILSHWAISVLRTETHFDTIKPYLSLSNASVTFTKLFCDAVECSCAGVFINPAWRRPRNPAATLCVFNPAFNIPAPHHPVSLKKSKQ